MALCSVLTFNKFCIITLKPNLSTQMGFCIKIVVWEIFQMIYNNICQRLNRFRLSGHPRIICILTIVSKISNSFKKLSFFYVCHKNQIWINLNSDNRVRELCSRVFVFLWGRLPFTLDTMLTQSEIPASTRATRSFLLRTLLIYVYDFVTNHESGVYWNLRHSESIRSIKNKKAVNSHRKHKNCQLQWLV